MIKSYKFCAVYKIADTWHIKKTWLQYSDEKSATQYVIEYNLLMIKKYNANGDTLQLAFLYC